MQPLTQWMLDNPDLPLTTKGGRKYPSLNDRIQRHSVPEQNGCIIWTGRFIGEYPYVSAAYAELRLNRTVFYLAHGRWPTVARHTCDDVRCVNPAHILDGTDQDNIYDIINRGRNHQMNKTHCPAGHPYDDDNTIVYIRKSNGRPARYCRACRHPTPIPRRESQ